MTVLQELHAMLARLDYPITKDEIIREMARRDVPPALLDRLRTLPEHTYGSVDTVMDALRGEE